MMALLEVSNLSVVFATRRGPLKAVDEVSFAIEPKETLGIVGESGSGKSVTSLALMGLLPTTATRSARKLQFNGKDLQGLGEKQYRALRGCEMSMIFQDPMTSLNPAFNVEFQIGEVLRAHQPELSNAQVKERTLELLNQVGIPDPKSRLKTYPHQLSGGMAQRVMIASAIACNPKLLIADEPTTALDVTIQAQILDLLKELQETTGMALILITHDLGVVARMADKVAVMYAGQMVESGRTRDVIQEPAHPYTHGLLACLPSRHSHSASKVTLPSIPGVVPDLVHRPSGCQMHPRCKFAVEQCRTNEPPMELHRDRLLKCFFPLGAHYA